VGGENFRKRVKAFNGVKISKKINRTLQGGEKREPQPPCKRDGEVLPVGTNERERTSLWEVSCVEAKKGMKKIHTDKPQTSITRRKETGQKHGRW